MLRKYLIYGVIASFFTANIVKALTITKTNDDDAVIVVDSHDDIGEPPASKIWQPKPGLTWWWQLENSDSIPTNVEVDVVDLDLYDGADGGKNSKIRQLKDNGKKVICYFSGGTFEKWRPDAKRFKKITLIPNGDMDDWPDEIWLNIGNNKALEIIKPIMKGRMAFASQSGCDAVEIDNVDAFENIDETKGYVTYKDQLNYNKWLANTAHQYNLAIGLKNNIQQLNSLLEYFDFAVNEQCFGYGNECIQYESTFLKAGKAVFNQEYGGVDGGVSRNKYKKSACSYFKSQKISSLWKNGTNLDGGKVLECQ